MNDQVVILTGGLGYIGSHIVVELQQLGYNVVVIDSCINASEQVLQNIQSITSKPLEGFHKIDLCNYDALLEALELYKNRIHTVIHLAGLKAVGESVEKPLMYYENNVSGSINLFKALHKCNATRIVFSSSATVYGVPQYLPLNESHPVSAVNPYGSTKVMIEEILEYFCKASGTIGISLRYFNPIGAHPSGFIGESPNGIPNNLMPYVAQVCMGTRPFVRIWGNDYPTPDGTGIRDYIHVSDLAQAHVAALDYLVNNPSCVYKVFNIGTGTGYSVLEVIKAMEKACGKPIPTEINPRRLGDVAECWADCTLSKSELNWTAQLTLDDMCRDLWNFQTKQVKP